MISPCPGTWASSKDMQLSGVRITGDSDWPLVWMWEWIVVFTLCQPCNTAGWWPVQGLSHLLRYGSWVRFQSSFNPELVKWKRMDGWTLASSFQFSSLCNHIFIHSFTFTNRPLWIHLFIPPSPCSSHVCSLHFPFHLTVLVSVTPLRSLWLAARLLGHVVHWLELAWSGNTLCLFSHTIYYLYWDTPRTQELVLTWTLTQTRTLRQTLAHTGI